MKIPPAWSVAPSGPTDWALIQQAKSLRDLSPKLKSAENERRKHVRAIEQAKHTKALLTKQVLFMPRSTLMQCQAALDASGLGYTYERKLRQRRRMKFVFCIFVYVVSMIPFLKYEVVIGSMVNSWVVSVIAGDGLNKLSAKGNFISEDNRRKLEGGAKLGRHNGSLAEIEDEGDGNMGDSMEEFTFVESKIEIIVQPHVNAVNDDSQSLDVTFTFKEEVEHAVTREENDEPASSAREVLQGSTENKNEIVVIPIKKYVVGSVKEDTNKESDRSEENSFKKERFRDMTTYELFSMDNSVTTSDKETSKANSKDSAIGSFFLSQDGDLNIRNSNFEGERTVHNYEEDASVASTDDIINERKEARNGQHLASMGLEGGVPLEAHFASTFDEVDELNDGDYFVLSHEVYFPITSGAVDENVVNDQERSNKIARMTEDDEMKREIETPTTSLCMSQESYIFEISDGMPNGERAKEINNYERNGDIPTKRKRKKLNILQRFGCFVREGLADDAIVILL